MVRGGALAKGQLRLSRYKGFGTTIEARVGLTASMFARG